MIHSFICILRPIVFHSIECCASNAALLPNNESAPLMIETSYSTRSKPGRRQDIKWQKWVPWNKLLASYELRQETTWAIAMRSIFWRTLTRPAPWRELPSFVLPHERTHQFFYSSRCASAIDLSSASDILRRTEPPWEQNTFKASLAGTTFSFPFNWLQQTVV